VTGLIRAGYRALPCRPGRTGPGNPPHSSPQPFNCPALRLDRSGCGRPLRSGAVLPAFPFPGAQLDAVRCPGRGAGWRAARDGGRGDGGQQGRGAGAVAGLAAWSMAARAAGSPVCGGTVSRSVRPASAIAVSSPAGMVSNQPSRTTRLPAGPSTRSRRGRLASQPAPPSMIRVTGRDAPRWPRSARAVRRPGRPTGATSLRRPARHRHPGRHCGCSPTCRPARCSTGAGGPGRPTRPPNCPG